MHHLRTLASLVAVAATLVCCNPNENRVHALPGASKPASAQKAVDSGVDSIPDSAASAGNPPGVQAAYDDLLSIAPSRVAVSSSVRNPKDFPEHLIDGDLATAWNSKTGDVKGAWIAFRVPADAWVRSVELTSGFTKRKGRDDLFVMNHRIVSVNVFRSGELIKQATLDPNARTIQPIEINASGGDFKLVIQSTLPGTRKDWKEIVVSEFRVRGTPGKERRKPTDKLDVGIGSLDATVDNEPFMDLSEDYVPAGARGLFASIEALCVTFSQWGQAHVAEAMAGELGWHDDDPLPKVECKEQRVTALQSGSPPWTGVKAVHLAFARISRTFLVGVRAEGLQVTPIIYADAPNPMGCASIWQHDELDRTFAENGWLIGVVQGAGPLIFDTQGRPEGVVTQQGASMCKLEGTKLQCREINPQYTRGFNYIPPGGREEWRENFHVAENGDIARTRIR
jgi:hypothetical protein